MGTQTSGGDAGWLVLTVSLRGAVRPAVQVLQKLQTGTNARTRMRYCSRGEEGCLSEAHWRRGHTGQDSAPFQSSNLVVSFGRTQQGAAGEADVWFRESWFCITKQNTEELICS